MSAERPHWLTASEAGAALRRREVSSRELIEDTLDWIEESDPVTNAWVTVTRDDALAAADAADRELASGHDRGPLHGIGFTVKDLIAVGGVPMGVGSKLAEGFVPRDDATVVARLRDAGAVCLGKTATHEFAFGSTTPPVRNPWDGASVPGGSSGGSAAAVAAGQATFGIGTDCCCSVRNPAALNGICGMRPTFGRVSVTGVVPASLGLDTVGPLCRSVRDVALALTAMSGHDQADPRSSGAPVDDFAAGLDAASGGLDGLRVGVPRSHFFEHVEVDVERNVMSALDVLESLGATLHPVDLPHARHGSNVFFVLVVAEAAALQHDHLRNGSGHLLGDDVRSWAEFGNLVLAKDYIRAQQMRALIVADWERAFEEVDAIVTPATAATAKRPVDHPVHIDVTYPDGFSEDVLFAYGRFLMPVSVAGLPGLVVPCGAGDGGLPVGLQVVAPAFGEATALRIGAAFEREAGMASRRPRMDVSVTRDPVESEVP